LPRAVNLDSAMIALLQDVGREVPAAIEVEVVAAPGLSPVLADPDGLAAALRELVRNACEAMPEGGRLTLEAANVRHGQDRLAVPGSAGYAQYVRLSVRDSGPGMAPGFAERAVAPFFTTKTGAAHTGLGLAMVYGFMSQSGGRMESYGIHRGRAARDQRRAVFPARLGQRRCARAGGPGGAPLHANDGLDGCLNPARSGRKGRAGRPAAFA
jgi:nitrogen-specific signal transduction histidine kinase